MSTWKRTHIELSKLKLNLDNYRFFEEADSEREAITKIIGDPTIQSSEQKFFTLLKHVAIHGLNPTDLLIVFPDGKSDYIVLEANRRIAALKLLETPEIVKESHPNLYKKIKPISDDYVKDPIQEVFCAVFDNQEEAELWIELKHTGQNEGAGTIGWNMQQQERFKGGKSLSIQALDLLKKSEYVEDSFKAKLPLVRSSHISRLLGDPDIRLQFGLSMKSGELYSEIPQKETTKGLVNLLNRTLKPGFSVNEIRHKSDRIRLLRSFDSHEIPDKSQKIQTWNLDSPPKESSKDNTKKEEKKTNEKSVPSDPKRKGKSTNRSRLIPLSCKIKITDTKPNDIYHELSTINVDEFPHAVGVLFRVFIEIGVDLYVKKNNVSIRSNDRLKEKITKVCNHMEQNGILSSDDLIAPRNVAKDDNNFLSVNTFHAFVHNPSYSPVPNDLKRRWDNIELFIKTIWANS